MIVTWELVLEHIRNHPNGATIPQLLMDIYGKQDYYSSVIRGKIYQRCVVLEAFGLVTRDLVTDYEHPTRVKPLIFWRAVPEVES